MASESIWAQVSCLRDMLDIHETSKPTAAAGGDSDASHSEQGAQMSLERVSKSDGQTWTAVLALLLGLCYNGL